MCPYSPDSQILCIYIFGILLGSKKWVIAHDILRYVVPTGEAPLQGEHRTDLPVQDHKCGKLLFPCSSLVQWFRKSVM